MQARWQRWAAMGCAVAAAGAVIFALFVVVQSSTTPSRGELGGIIAFAVFMALLALGAATAAVAAWFWFFHVKAARWTGFGVVALIALFFAAHGLSTLIAAHQDRKAAREVGAVLDEIGERYIARLAAEDPLPDEAIAMFNDFLRDIRAAPYHRLPDSELDRAFRARWFIYFWTFYDPKFEGFTTYYPKLEDCTFFLETFGARYAQVAPVAIFEELCTDRWNPDGSERG